ncbi:MAG: phosphoribosyl-ATP diphosphatase [Candidatus Diapherotrites archaeon CG10_big_fil_rev_8_21_14_0_10_31_34]|nr:MAG: phosphoribosyl-ATP diphosphatase [Candidatus Diapherotrites archaeon CG10_big_fil_rev_8_21_14_0_10_31_34]
MINQKKKKYSEKSVTCKLLKNRKLILDKIAEESWELIEASEEKEKKEVVWEAADLLYFFMALLASRNIRLNKVFAELKRRNNEPGKD